MLAVGCATESELPITLRVGEDSFGIQTVDQAKFFSLGMLAALEAKTREEEGAEVTRDEDYEFPAPDDSG